MLARYGKEMMSSDDQGECRIGASKDEKPSDLPDVAVAGQNFESMVIKGIGRESGNLKP